MTLKSIGTALLLIGFICEPLRAQESAIHDEPIEKPVIVYPAEAKHRHIQGVVELEVRVSETGRVTAVRALSGPEELRQAAVEAYAQASYRPMMRAGRAIPAVVRTSVDFSLHEAAPSPDDRVAAEFEPVHAQCEGLARARDAGALAVCQQALGIAGHFSPTGHMVAHAVAYNDLALLLLVLGKPAQAAILGDEAVAKIAEAYPGSLAAANAFVTRAETRARFAPVPNLKGSIADCMEAERILRGLLAQQQAPYLADDIKAQLKGVLRLHAVVLRRNFQGGKAKALEDEADKL